MSGNIHRFQGEGCRYCWVPLLNLLQHHFNLNWFVEVTSFLFLLLLLFSSFSSSLWIAHHVNDLCSIFYCSAHLSSLHIRDFNSILCYKYLLCIVSILSFNLFMKVFLLSTGLESDHLGSNFSHPLTSCVTLRKLFKLYVFQCLQLWLKYFVLLYFPNKMDKPNS